MKWIWKLVSKVLSLFLSVCLFLIIFIYAFFDISKDFITKENMKAIHFNQVITEDIKEESIEYYNFVQTMLNLADVNEIEHDIFIKIINHNDIREVLSNYYSKIQFGIYSNSSIEIQITEKEMLNILNNSLDDITSEYSLLLDFEQRIKIKEIFNEEIEKILDSIPTYNEYFESQKENMESLKTLSSDLTKIVMIVIMILISIIIILLNWSIYKFAIWTGLPFAISGLISIAIEENSFLVKCKTLGNILLIVGAIQLIYYFVMKKIRN